MEQRSNLPGWNLVWWLFGIFGFPVAVPWLVYHLYNLMMNKHRKQALKGKVVMITGASSGLGEAMAHVFYNCGCKLILIARREKELQRVKETLMKTYHTDPIYPPVICTLDLADIEALPFEIEKVLQIYNGIDVVINNAGIAFRGGVMDTKIDVDMKVMRINYFAQIAVSKAVLPRMLKQNSGHLVCISSVQGKIALPFRSAYTASKHALQAWCDSARAELADKNINVSVINIGYIKTSLSLNAITGDGQKYGVMDEATEKGYLPEYVAEQVLIAVLQKNKEVTVADSVARGAMVLRNFFPSLFFWVMQRRAKSQKKDA